MMEVFPTVGKALILERNIDELAKKEQELKEEIQRLENQRASLIQTPMPMSAAQPATAIPVPSQ